jgi:hypothetical protein
MKRRQDENSRKVRNEKAERIYKKILEQEKSALKYIEDIRNAYFLQKKSGIKVCTASWGIIAMNHIPPSLKDKPKDWLSFVAIHRFKLKVKRLQKEDLTKSKKETRDMLNTRSYGEQLEISFV